MWSRCWTTSAPRAWRSADARWAATRPSPCCAARLIGSPGCCSPTPAPRRIPTPPARRGQPCWHCSTATAPRRWPPKCDRSSSGPRRGRSAPTVLAVMDGMMDRATARGIGFAVARLRNRPDATTNLAAFRGPVSVVVGEEDMLTPPVEAAAMAAGVPGAVCVTIPRAGHVANLESPGAFNEPAMREWLHAVARAAAGQTNPETRTPDTAILGLTDKIPTTTWSSSAAWDWPALWRSPGKVLPGCTGPHGRPAG